MRDSDHYAANVGWTFRFASQAKALLAEGQVSRDSGPARGSSEGAPGSSLLGTGDGVQQRPFWQAHYYDFNVSAHEKYVEKLRYIHLNPVRRGLATKPEDWKWSSFRHYQTGVRGTVEIESEWTARQRGWQVPEWMRDRLTGSSRTPVPESEGLGAPSS